MATRFLTEQDANRLDSSIAVERARVDQLTSLPNGSTTGDAELQDIRVGYDGTSYNSAGNAVRTQVSDIERRLKQAVVYVAGTEKVELVYGTNGYYGTTGAFTIAADTARYATVDNVVAGDKYIIDTFLNNPSIPAIVYFDVNGDFIGYDRLGTGSDAIVHHTFVIPSGVTRFVVQSARVTDTWPSLSVVDRTIERSFYTKSESDVRYLEPFGRVDLVGKNLFNVNAVTLEGWADTTNGKIQMYPNNQYVKNYSFSDYIPVIGGETYTYSGGADGYTHYHSYVWYNARKEFISSVSDVYNGAAIQITAPENAAYIIFNYTNGWHVYNVQFEKGSVRTEYEEYQSASGYKLPNLIINNEQVPFFAEVQDARTGLDDREYATIGEAVRTQFSKVASEIQSIDEKHTAVDNELTDVRLGINDVTYPTAGDAVRGQFLNINAEVNSFGKTILTRERKNLFNVNTVTLEGWAATTNGKIQMYPSNQYVEKFSFSDYIPVIGGETYTYSGGADGYTLYHSYVWYNAQKEFISSVPDVYTGSAVRITAPENAAYIIFNYSGYAEENLNTVQFEKGTERTEYEEYLQDSELILGYALPDLILSIAQIADYSAPKVDIEYAKLKLPDKFDLVVGDTFELFKRGIVNCINPEVYDLEFYFSDNQSYGSNFARKYVYTPTSSDVGEKTVTIKLRDNAGVLCDEQTVIFNIVAQPTAVSKPATILCIGDSLTAGGNWPAELRRRLTASNGTPVGYGLSNIAFIGSKETEDGTKYEGYGGWTINSYMTASNRDDLQHIYGTFNKTVSDQHSTYVDSNGAKWKLEDIGATKMKIIRISGSTALPTSGTLTWVSGGANTSDIVYTSSGVAEGNPFWDATANKNNFKKYATNQGVSTITHAIILIGWNSSGTSEETYKENCRDFLNGLLADFPSCKITFCGLQVPSRDGFAQNYGVAWPYWDKLQYVWNLQQWYMDLCKEDAYVGKVEYVNISGQFDSDYNMPMTQYAVNTRNTTKLMLGNNGVHPDISGYMQIADAVLRNICTKL